MAAKITSQTVPASAPVAGTALPQKTCGCLRSNATHLGCRLLYGQAKRRVLFLQVVEFAECRQAALLDLARMIGRLHSRARLVCARAVRQVECTSVHCHFITVIAVWGLRVGWGKVCVCCVCVCCACLTFKCTSARNSPPKQKSVHLSVCNRRAYQDTPRTWRQLLAAHRDPSQSCSAVLTYKSAHLRMHTLRVKHTRCLQGREGSSRA